MTPDDSATTVDEMRRNAPPLYRAVTRVIASTMAAEPNAEDFAQARAVVSALLRAGYTVIPMSSIGGRSAR